MRTNIKIETGTDFILEAIIDDLSLNVLLAKLANICLDKAEHVATNWQDKPLAERWEKRGKTLSALSVRI